MLSITEKRESWLNTIAFNNIEGEYKPSSYLLELIEKQITGYVSYDEMILQLIEKHKKDIEGK